MHRRPARRHSRRTAALIAAGALTLTGWTAVAPGSATAAASGPTQSVTVLLDAPDRAGLAALSAQPIGDRAQRLTQLAALVPSSVQRGSVAATLHDEGFTVVNQSTWSLTATAPASVVADTFGSRPALAAHATPSQWQAATGSLPQIPAALSGLVSAAYPTTGGPAPFERLTSSLAGPDFRKADTPAGATPSTGAHDSGLTVATLQLATFDKSDLSNFASEHGIHDPVANGYYQEEQVDGGATSSDGDIEVDLDQQSILSTARNAHQLAYFAPNTNAGFSDVFASLYDDVTGAAGARHPDPHLVAISVSWGQCEAGWGAAAINALEPIMESVVAAGVNIFSSSGDDGIYDCRSATGLGTDNTQEDVDFPSSSPAVVSVGGTHLSAAKSTPNTGTNWTETSWTCTNASSCENTTTGTGGTGGGVSGAAFGTGPNQGDFRGFAKPAYQRTFVKSAPFAAATTRMVPDIAADGDPQSGFVLYTSDPQYVGLCGGNDCQVGGTSLAAPISAAQFANLLGDSGRTTGVGDIHTALYRAQYQNRTRPATSALQPFRDVTVGSNGAAANAKKDPSVKAAAGYDTNTGLGGVLWPGLKNYLVP